ITLWEDTLSHYQETLEQHVSNKKDNSLIALDEWYQETLPSILKTREPKYIDSKELCQLMSWKLKRGKFRPSLAKLAESNADKDVKRISQEAFKLVPSNLKASIVKMSELKGVGPATASAILCAGAPDSVPFMADETMDSVPGLGTIAYTIPYYIKFATKVIEKANELKKKGSTTVNSPHLVEKALWADYMTKKYGIKEKLATSRVMPTDDTKPVTKAKAKDVGVPKRKARESTESDSVSENQPATGKKAKITGSSPTALPNRVTRSRS
ncbi:hypothetical protein BGZ76_010459, partial [Entomortierella beljakovae]